MDRHLQSSCPSALTSLPLVVPNLSLEYVFIIQHCFHFLIVPDYSLPSNIYRVINLTFAITQLYLLQKLCDHVGLRSLGRYHTTLHAMATQFQGSNGQRILLVQKSIGFYPFKLKRLGFSSVGPDTWWVTSNFIFQQWYKNTLAVTLLTPLIRGS